MECHCGCGRSDEIDIHFSPGPRLCPDIRNTGDVCGPQNGPRLDKQFDVVGCLVEKVR
jgi:hypothetical protein